MLKTLDEQSMELWKKVQVTQLHTLLEMASRETEVGNLVRRSSSSLLSQNPSTAVEIPQFQITNSEGHYCTRQPLKPFITLWGDWNHLSLSEATYLNLQLGLFLLRLLELCRGHLDRAVDRSGLPFGVSKEIKHIGQKYGCAIFWGCSSVTCSFVQLSVQLFVPGTSYPNGSNKRHYYYYYPLQVTVTWKASCMVMYRSQMQTNTNIIWKLRSHGQEERLSLLMTT